MSTEPRGGVIGLFGGTFDPIHYGHLRLAEEAREQLDLATVRFIPAGQPPHRDRPGASAADRLAMTGLAIADNPAFALDPAEALTRAPSYTISTLERLRAELGPRQPLVLLLGRDAFLGLPGWRRWRDIFAHAHIAVANRPGYALDPLAMDATLATECVDRASAPQDLAAHPAGRIVQFQMTPLTISATDLRRRRRAALSLRYLLPPPVLDYISLHQLYP
jgi:nicotinate-nucleotide adenylyltransferase